MLDIQQKAVLDWEPVRGDMTTRWTAQVNPESALPEYPRPQMVREKWMNLNGLWDYVIRPLQDDEIREYDGRILVPFPIESSLSGVKKALQPHERLWYRRRFTVPPGWKGQRLLLHFGAVDWKTEVWVNGQKAGEHTGGYYPFSFDITPYLTEAENELVVSVWDPTETYGQERGKQSLQPKGLFYTAVSGIWQTVWLEPVPDRYIQSVKLTPQLEAGQITIRLEIEGGTSDGPDPWEMEASVYDQGTLIGSLKGPADDLLTLDIPEPKPWSPDSPFLYDLTIQLVRSGETVDAVNSYFGMRSFTVGHDSLGLKRLLLNGAPLFQQGILDQGYWPEGLYTAPTDEALEYDIIAAKNMGFNMIRKHIKVEPARWYYHCDRHGVLVWQDMINGGSGWNHLHHLILPNLFRSFHVNDTSASVYKALGREEQDNRDNFRKELKEMVDALYNVPSIGMWVPFNEAWGQFNAAETAQWLQAYDPTRWVDHASGWHDQRVGDIKSIHVYFRKLQLPKHIRGRTVVVSEYGCYSYQEKGHMWREDKAFGYRTFKTKVDLSAAYATLMKDQLKPLIPQGVSAAVYTQLTDVETETNGLLTYDREVIKIDISWLASLHQDLMMDSEN